MSWLAGAAGWLSAGVAVALWLVAARTGEGRMEAVARACHELRGPIGAARLGLELGADRRPLSRTELRAIHSELGRAALALDDLAAAMHGRPAADSPASDPGVVDLPALLRDSVQAWRPTAARAGVELSLECPAMAPLMADELRLAQAIGNLIANASRHAFSRVGVRASADDEAVRIEVSDDGPGLPAPVAELVGRARRGRGAHGRGLAIAAGVAAVHGGRLSAAPCARGARLVLELPVVAVPSRTGSARNSRPGVSAHQPAQGT
jgi:signal transduction histidine kinase